MRIIIISLLESQYRAFYNSLKKETKVLRTCVTGRKTEAVESDSVATIPRPRMQPSPTHPPFSIIFLLRHIHTFCHHSSWSRSSVYLHGNRQLSPPGGAHTDAATRRGLDPAPTCCGHVLRKGRYDCVPPAPGTPTTPIPPSRPCTPYIALCVFVNGEL